MPNGRDRTHGRPSKLTPDIQTAICKQLELSVPEKYAAEANGIDESTFHDWMKKGAAAVRPYAAFRDAVMRARARAVVNLTARALAGGKGSSQATWFLERRFREEYGAHVSAGSAPGADPVRFQQVREAGSAIRADPVVSKMFDDVIAFAAARSASEREAGSAIRADPVASKMFHDVIAFAAARSQAPKGKIT